MAVKIAFSAALAGTIILVSFLCCKIVDAKTASGNQAVLLSRLLKAKSFTTNTGEKHIRRAGAIELEAVHGEEEEDYFDEENEGEDFADSLNDVDRIFDGEWEEGDDLNQWPDDEEYVADDNLYVHMSSDDGGDMLEEDGITTDDESGGITGRSLGVALPTDRGNKLIETLEKDGRKHEDELEQAKKILPVGEEKLEL